MPRRSHALQKPIHALRASVNPLHFRVAGPLHARIANSPHARVANPLQVRSFSQSVDYPPPSNHWTGSDEPPHLAVLGGGITGLTSAFYLAKEWPEAKITVYEAAPRVGGWMSSKHVDVAGGKVLFEQGPRSLRSKHHLSTAMLRSQIQELGLEDQVITQSKDSPAALNRFIYYPDKLVKAPGPDMDIFQLLYTIFFEPTFSGIFSAVLREPFAAKGEAEDESVGDFLNRRFGTTKPTDNVVSAVLHGIYAGDVYKLSARTMMSLHWLLEKKHGSIFKGFLKHRKSSTNPLPISKSEAMWYDGFKDEAKKLRPEFLEKLKDASIFSFKNGISTLTTGLADFLRENPNVTFKTNTIITRIEPDQKTGKVQLTTAPTSNPQSPSPDPSIHDLTISALSASTLRKIASSPSNPTPLGTTDLAPSVTVAVVNLFYPPSTRLPVSGFGYLLPRSVPLDQNPERALGVIFDSDAMPGQDTVEGTKLTVMLGGHWWDGYSASDLPSDDEAVSMARSILARHLNIQDAPLATNVSLQKDCIPQYTVGYIARLKTLHRDLKDWMGGRVVVAGNSYSGVGVHDCIKSGRQVGRLVGRHGLWSRRTGLEDLVDEEWYSVVVNDRRGQESEE
ncbi:Protoporphyrinogen oxidase [Saccharata proteae CBS 121410]|uniref:Protoporphyrinogen oxidase n=1 Tax=Saccharata proteae CBS 121410 TaxID=1314787 RepID=A0A9P4HL88_9PEZI|nr:Protoporphyrinogen oxidase [Saccharata proteae CBS 121410]